MVILEYYCKENWQSKVYKPKIDDYDWNSPDWISIRVFISIQQKSKCARCKKVIDFNHLTIHHIISREEGGGNNIENLIGLCRKCHDFIEPLKLNRKEIINYNKRRKMKKKANKNDWHLWVYGGHSRPDMKKTRHNSKININTDIINKGEYKFPNDIKLLEKYIIKRYLTKYTLKYGYTLKEMAKILRMNPSTIIHWIKDPVKENRLIKILNNMK